MRYLFRTAGAVVLKVIYGYTMETTRPDPLVQMADSTVILIVRAFQPAARLVDMIPARESFIVIVR